MALWQQTHHGRRKNLSFVYAFHDPYVIAGQGTIALEIWEEKPLIKNPEIHWKSAVFSQYHRRPKVTPDKKRYMGYSMVIQKYHYMEWRFWNNERKVTTDVAAIELYDNNKDPDENINIADYPENKKIVEQLSKQLKAWWRAAFPKNTKG